MTNTQLLCLLGLLALLYLIGVWVGWECWGKQAKHAKANICIMRRGYESMREDCEVQVKRLQAALDFVSTSGQELFPVGPVEVIFAEDGNTVLGYVGPWYFQQGQGATFLDAVEDAMRKAK